MYDFSVYPAGIWSPALSRATGAYVGLLARVFACGLCRPEGLKGSAAGPALRLLGVETINFRT